MKKYYLEKFFPIKPQNSNYDKRIVLNIINILQKEFNYLEIGSYLNEVRVFFNKFFCNIYKFNFRLIK